MCLLTYTLPAAITREIQLIKTLAGPTADNATVKAVTPITSKKSFILSPC